MTFEDRRFDYGEQRFVTLGMLRGDVVVVITAETLRQVIREELKGRKAA